MIFNNNIYLLKNKVAIVTGALGYIGQQICRQLIDRGAKVVLADIHDLGSDYRQFIEELSQKAEPNEKVAEYVQVDLRNLDNIQHLFDRAIGIFGTVDIIVNNAAIIPLEKFYQGQTAEHMAATIDVNLRCPMELSRIFVRYLQTDGKEGVVVNIASSGGMSPSRGLEIYGATKAGLIYFTELHRYLAPQIRFTAIAPFFVDTPTVRQVRPLQGTPALSPYALLKVNDVADAVVRQIEDKKSGGKTVMLIGGWQCLPVWHMSIAQYYVSLVILAALIWGRIKSFFGLKAGSKYN